jgi:hypothetical protein
MALDQSQVGGGLGDGARRGVQDEHSDGEEDDSGKDERAPANEWDRRDLHENHLFG